MNIKKEYIVLIITAILITTVVVLLLTHFSVTLDNTMTPDHQPETLIEIRGKVERYGTNLDGNIDKIMVAYGDTEKWIHFPPHTAKEVLSVAGIKTIISATTLRKGRVLRDAISAYELLTVSSADKTIDVTSIPPPPPAVGKMTEVSGNKIEYQKDENGYIKAFILSGKLIMLPPHTRELLLPLLAGAKKVTVKGVQRDKNSGFVNENIMDVVQPSTVVIDSVNYLIQ